MQILIFEDATCVLKICMIVAPGFVGNLLWKWIHNAANRNETCSTLPERVFVFIFLVIVSLVSIVLHHLRHKRKTHKTPGKSNSVYSLRHLCIPFRHLQRVSFFQYSRYLFVFQKGEKKQCVCFFLCFVPNNFRTTLSIFVNRGMKMPLKPHLLVQFCWIL